MDCRAGPHPSDVEGKEPQTDVDLGKSPVEAESRVVTFLSESSVKVGGKEVCQPWSAGLGRWTEEREGDARVERNG